MLCMYADVCYFPRYILSVGRCTTATTPADEASVLVDQCRQGLDEMTASLLDIAQRVTDANLQSGGQEVEVSMVHSHCSFPAMCWVCCHQLHPHCACMSTTRRNREDMKAEKAFGV